MGAGSSSRRAAGESSRIKALAIGRLQTIPKKASEEEDDDEEQQALPQDVDASRVEVSRVRDELTTRPHFENPDDELIEQ